MGGGEKGRRGGKLREAERGEREGEKGRKGEGRRGEGLREGRERGGESFTTHNFNSFFFLKKKTNF